MVHAPDDNCIDDLESCNIVDNTLTLWYNSTSVVGKVYQFTVLLIRNSDPKWQVWRQRPLSILEKLEYCGATYADWQKKAQIIDFQTKADAFSMHSAVTGRFDSSKRSASKFSTKDACQNWSHLHIKLPRGRNSHLRRLQIHIFSSRHRRRLAWISHDFTALISLKCQ